MILAFLLFSLLVAVSSVATNDVVTLDTKNFADTLKNRDDDMGWMVKFYAPWCGHCKKLAPTWTELAKSSDGEFGVGSLDCTTSQPICTQYKIRGYPTLKFIKDNKMYAYQGARSVEALKEFATRTYQDAEVTDL